VPVTEGRTGNVQADDPQIARLRRVCTRQ